MLIRYVTVSPLFEQAIEDGLMEAVYLTADEKAAFIEWHRSLAAQAKSAMKPDQLFYSFTLKPCPNAPLHNARCAVSGDLAECSTYALYFD